MMVAPEINNSNNLYSNRCRHELGCLHYIYEYNVNATYNSEMITKCPTLNNVIDRHIDSAQ